VSCGCGSTGAGVVQPNGGAVCTLRSGRRAPIAWAERSYMCSSCRHCSGKLCTAAPQPVLVQVRILGNDCPRGRFPRHRRVRWLGLKWVGVPWPIRIWMHATARLRDLEALPGCGCLVGVKLAAMRLRRAMRTSSS